MSGAPAAPAPTAALIGDRWHEAMSERFFGLQCSTGRVTGGLDPVRGAVRSLPLGTLTFHQIRGNRQFLDLTRTATRREPSDRLKVCLIRRGRVLVEQNDRTVDVGPGEFALYDTARPYRLSFAGDWEVSVLTVPPHALDLSQQRVARLMERPIDVRNGPGQVFASYLSGLAAVETAQQATVDSLGRAGLSLLTGALTENLAAAADAVPDALATQLIRYVEAHLADPDLGLAAIAAAHHLTPRTVQRTVAAQGLTISALIRERRLDAIRRDLLDPGQAHRTVSMIAARRGVTDASWLSRNFRAAYGQTPSRYRQEHRSAVTPT